MRHYTCTASRFCRISGPHSDRSAIPTGVSRHAGPVSVAIWRHLRWPAPPRYRFMRCRSPHTSAAQACKGLAATPRLVHNFCPASVVFVCCMSGSPRVVALDACHASLSAAGLVAPPRLAQRDFCATVVSVRCMIGSTPRSAPLSAARPQPLCLITLSLFRCGDVHPHPGRLSAKG